MCSEMNSNNDKLYVNRDEYTRELSDWLEKARTWHTLCSNIPTYIKLQENENQNQNYPINQQTNLPQFGYNNVRTNNFTTNQNVIFERTTFPNFVPERYYEFKIPPLWKRMAAECFDFFILAFIKLVITLFLTESLFAVNLDNIRKNLSDPKIAIQMTMEIIILELLHRSIVCIYEVYWICGHMCATPGKRCLGIIVLKVDNIIPVQGTNELKVRCSNVSQLDITNSIYRSVLKNILLGIMLPICFAVYIFRFNRTGYDTFSKCLVVECDSTLPLRPVA